MIYWGVKSEYAAGDSCIIYFKHFNSNLWKISFFAGKSLIHIIKLCKQAHKFNNGVTFSTFFSSKSTQIMKTEEFLRKIYNFCRLWVYINASTGFPYFFSTNRRFSKQNCWKEKIWAKCFVLAAFRSILYLKLLQIFRNIG